MEGIKMNHNKFMDYIRKNFDISGEADRLIDNILFFVEGRYQDENEQYNVLCELLDGTIGLEDNEIKMVCM